MAASYPYNEARACTVQPEPERARFTERASKRWCKWLTSSDTSTTYLAFECGVLHGVYLLSFCICTDSGGVDVEFVGRPVCVLCMCLWASERASEQDAADTEAHTATACWVLMKWVLNGNHIHGHTNKMTWTQTRVYATVTWPFACVYISAFASFPIIATQLSKAFGGKRMSVGMMTSLL